MRLRQCRYLLTPVLILPATSVVEATRYASRLTWTMCEIESEEEPVWGIRLVSMTVERQYVVKNINLLHPAFQIHS